jgi:hypothetical protein
MNRIYSFVSCDQKGNISEGRIYSDFVNNVYRTTYIIITWLVTSFVLTHYSTLLTGVLPPSKFFREFIICGGQIIFQSIVLLFLNKDKVLEYLGNMMTISFCGAFLLLIIMGLSRLIQYSNPVAFTCLFMMVAGLMFLEHWRRMKIIGVSWLASIGWVVYRIIVLWFIF